MTGPAFERRQSQRRAADKNRVDGGANVPAVIEGETARAKAEAGDGGATFKAHLYGQTGQKRGLRAGQPVIDQARSAYLETEFSGPDDRRPPKGLLKKTQL